MASGFHFWKSWRQVKNSFFFDKDEGRKQPRPNIIVLFGYRAAMDNPDLGENLLFKKI